MAHTLATNSIGGGAVFGTPSQVLEDASTGKARFDSARNLVEQIASS